MATMTSRRCGDARFDVTGVISSLHEHVSWVHSKILCVGDKVQIEIVEAPDAVAVVEMAIAVRGGMLVTVAVDAVDARVLVVVTGCCAGTLASIVAAAIAAARSVDLVGA